MPKQISESFILLCDLLSDGEWHDGNALGEKLSLSRSGVWKGIKKLQHYAVPIHVKRGKGYQLVEPLHLLNPNLLTERIHCSAGIEVFETIPSTNEYVKSVAAHKQQHICLAEEQRHGKGRLGRTWCSPFGKNIYLSYLYTFHKDISELAGLSLVISLAILSALKSFGIKEHLTAKWPNDILYQDKKLAGTLIDVLAESNGTTQAVIGIGLNVNMQHDSARQAIDQPWTSVAEITGKHVDRNALLPVVIHTLVDYLQTFATHGFAALREEWLLASQYLGKTIALKNAATQIEGVVVDVNEQGHLVIESDGKRQTYSAGDTSIIR